jgi:dynein heavy chain, axonemal
MLTEKGFAAVAAGDNNGVVVAKDKQSQIVIDLIKLTMGDLNKPTRTKVMCMITLDAHNRDVCVKLVQDQVTVATSFQW